MGRAGSRGAGPGVGPGRVGVAGGVRRLVADGGWPIPGPRLARARGDPDRCTHPVADTIGPTPTVAPDAPAYVTGTGIRTQQSAGTTTLDNKGIAHTLGVVIGVATDLDDPRVTGTGTYRLSVDASGSLGFTQGTFRLDVPGGAWEGTCSGSTWADLGAGQLSCWLPGSGSYAGMTLYLNHRFGEDRRPISFWARSSPAHLRHRRTRRHMMRTIVRSIAVLAFAAGLVVACGAAAPTPTATPAPTPSAATATQATATATPATPAPTGTPVPTPTAVPSVGPMDPAHVTGTGTLSQAYPGTTTAVGDCTRVDGVVVEATGTSSDPRVAGAAMKFTVSGLDCGGVGFEWGTMSLTKADGAWEGTCTGGTWASGYNSDISCWLVGSGAYKGLTYYMHSRNAELSVAVDGVILPAPPPATR